MSNESLTEAHPECVHDLGSCVYCRFSSFLNFLLVPSADEHMKRAFLQSMLCNFRLKLQFLFLWWTSSWCMREHTYLYILPFETSVDDFNTNISDFYTTKWCNPHKKWNFPHNKNLTMKKNNLINQLILGFWIISFTAEIPCWLQKAEYAEWLISIRLDYLQCRQLWLIYCHLTLCVLLCFQN